MIKLKNTDEAIRLQVMERNSYSVQSLLDFIRDSISKVYAKQVLPFQLEFNKIEYYDDTDEFNQHVSNAELDSLFNIKDLFDKWSRMSAGGERTVSLKDDVLSVTSFEEDGSFSESFSIRGYRSKYEVIFCVKYVSKYISSLVDIKDLYL